MSRFAGLNKSKYPDESSPESEVSFSSIFNCLNPPVSLSLRALFVRPEAFLAAEFLYNQEGGGPTSVTSPLIWRLSAWPCHVLAASGGRSQMRNNLMLSSFVFLDLLSCCNSKRFWLKKTLASCGVLGDVTAFTTRSTIRQSP